MSEAVLQFSPKYRLGHPENNLFVLSKKNIGLKYPKKKTIQFWKKNSWPEVKGFNFQCILEIFTHHQYFYFQESK